jgi:hypothetical protein
MTERRRRAGVHLNSSRIQLASTKPTSPERRTAASFALPQLPTSAGLCSRARTSAVESCETLSRRAMALASMVPSLTELTVGGRLPSRGVIPSSTRRATCVPARVRSPALGSEDPGELSDRSASRSRAQCPGRSRRPLPGRYRWRGRSVPLLNRACELVSPLMAQLVRRVSGLPRGIDNPRRVTERFPDTREGRRAADGWAKGLDDSRTFYDVRTRIDGRVVTKSFTTRKAARAWATQIAHDKLTGVAIDPRSGDELFSHYAQRWLDTRRVKGRPLAPKTLELYRVLLRAHIEPAFSSRQLSAITPEAVRRWHAKVSSDSSAMSAAKSYRLLRAILATAVADDLIQANPCRVRGAGMERSVERPIVGPELVLELADAIGAR